MDGNLYRFAYTPEDTQGRLVFGDWDCWTIEQPWVHWNYPGGRPFESCVPDGTYTLLPFLRPSGEQAFILVNPDLGVYFNESDRPNGNGRYLCLIHAANYASDVEGCIGPGRKRFLLEGKIMVTDSQDTMHALRDVVGWSGEHTLRIQCATGAIDTPLAA